MNYVLWLSGGASALHAIGFQFTIQKLLSFFKKEEAAGDTEDPPPKMLENHWQILLTLTDQWMVLQQEEATSEF